MDASGRRNDGTKRGPLARISALGVLGAAAWLAVAAPSCSLIVDTNANQCDESTACPDGRKCVEGVCASGCTKTSECAGDFQFCRKDPGATVGSCVALKSPECQVIEGNYQADNVVLLGSIHPTDAGPDTVVGVSMENSVRLAVQELKTINGLPPEKGQMGNRQVVMIGCNDAGEEETGVKAAKHLVNDLGVQVIIGGAFSGVAIKTATDVTIPNKVLLISASATSPAITDLADKPAGSNVGLVWRTVPSDLFQAKAMKLHVGILEDQIRTELNLGSNPIKIAILYKGDAYGTGLKNALQESLVFNGKPALDNGENYFTFDYGNPDDAASTLKFDQAVNEAITRGSHIVMLFGTSETIGSIFSPIELGWNEGLGYHPRYVFSDSPFGSGISDAVNKGENDPVKRGDWRRRTTGVVPGPQNSDKLYKLFQSAYAGSFQTGDPTIFGAASAYDAAYLSIFSMAATSDGPVTGLRLASAMTRMSKADPPNDAVVEAGSTQLGRGITKLSSGEYKSIDYVGAFGPLDFDPDTGEAGSNVQVFCLADDGTGKAVAQLSGQYYDALTQKMAGTFADACK